MEYTEEHWKLVKEYEVEPANKLSTHLKGDKIFVSDKGRVKFNELILEIGFGLYLDEKDICMVGYKWPYNTLYRTIYTLFKGEITEGKIIHHIDGNHLNNSLDNLVELTNDEHTRIHANGLYYEYDIEWIETNNKDRSKHIKVFRDYLHNRVDEWLAERKKQNEQKLIEQKQQKEIEKQKEIADKLASGLYQYNKKGTLCRTTTAKKGYVTPLEVRIKQSIAIKKLYADNEEYREKNKMNRSTGKGCKYVKGDDGKLHRTYVI